MAASSLVRPPSASLIVRSLSKSPASAHNSWNANLPSSSPEVTICRRFCILGAADLLLAMQKVEDSNPFSRSLGSGSTEPQTASRSPCWPRSCKVVSGPGAQWVPKPSRPE